MIRLGDRCKYFNSMVLRPVFFWPPPVKRKEGRSQKGATRQARVRPALALAALCCSSDSNFPMQL